MNFAAETHVDRSIAAAGEFITTDVFGTHVLLEFARVAGIRFVQVSTDEVYGDMPEGESATEDYPPASLEPLLRVEGGRETSRFSPTSARMA